MSTSASAPSIDLMKPKEAASVLLTTEKTLANQRSRRVGPPYVRLSGGAIRYSRNALLAWIEQNSVIHGGAA